MVPLKVQSTQVPGAALKVLMLNPISVAGVVGYKPDPYLSILSG